MTSFLKKGLSEIENTLENLVSTPSKEPHDSLFDAARYALLSGGKRLRPLLTLATAHDLGGGFKRAVIPACAVELIHTYSLIHDDLPCMDDDDMRRGKPSLHKAFDEGLAVLTGDFLLTKAFELSATAPHLSSDRRLCLTQILALHAGSEGIIGGQVVDIASKGSKPTNKQHEWINLRKTGALFIAALEFGGIVTGATDKELTQLRLIGSHFGLAFQFHDDLEDSEGVNLENKIKNSLDNALKALAAFSKPMPLLKKLIVEYNTQTT